MGTLWSRSGSVEFSNTGSPISGATVNFYLAGTTTPFTVYQDGDETTPHEEEIEADGVRWPAVYIPVGTSYKYVTKTSGGTTLFTADNISNPAPTDPGVGVDADSIFQTGDTIISFKNGTRTGFVRCNGRTIGSAASAGTERANADCEDLFIYLWNASANAQLAVSGGRGATGAADFAANKTIAMPDGRNAGLIGFGDMGNSDAGLVASAPVVSGSGILAGSIIGANTHVLTSGQMAAHTHSFSATSGAGSAHTHGLGTASAASDGGGTFTSGTESVGLFPHYNTAASKTSTHTAGGADSNWNGADTDATGPQLTTHTHNTTITAHTHALTGALANESSHTHSVSGTSGSTGSDTAHNILSRSIPVTVLMKL